MEFSAPITITTPAGNLTFNNPASDSYMMTALEGFDDPEARVVIDPLSGEDGSVVHSVLDEAIYGTARGYIRVSTVSARNTAEHDMRTKLRSIRRVDGQFQITEQGYSMMYLVVRRYTPVVFAPEDGIIHSFQFSLVSVEALWH